MAEDSKVQGRAPTSEEILKFIDNKYTISSMRGDGIDTHILERDDFLQPAKAAIKKIKFEIGKDIIHEKQSIVLAIYKNCLHRENLEKIEIIKTQQTNAKKSDMEAFAARRKSLIASDIPRRKPKITEEERKAEEERLKREQAKLEYQRKEKEAKEKKLKKIRELRKKEENEKKLQTLKKSKEKATEVPKKEEPARLLPASLLKYDDLYVKQLDFNSYKSLNIELSDLIGIYSGISRVIQDYVSGGESYNAVSRYLAQIFKNNKEAPTNKLASFINSIFINLKPSITASKPKIFNYFNQIQNILFEVSKGDITDRNVIIDKIMAANENPIDYKKTYASTPSLDKVEQAEVSSSEPNDKSEDVPPVITEDTLSFDFSHPVKDQRPKTSIERSVVEVRDIKRPLTSRAIKGEDENDEKSSVIKPDDKNKGTVLPLNLRTGSSNNEDSDNESLNISLKKRPNTSKNKRVHFKTPSVMKRRALTPEGKYRNTDDLSNENDTLEILNRSGTSSGSRSVTPANVENEDITSEESVANSFEGDNEYDIPPLDLSGIVYQDDDIKEDQDSIFHSEGGKSYNYKKMKFGKTEDKPEEESDENIADAENEEKQTEIIDPNLPDFSGYRSILNDLQDVDTTINSKKNKQSNPRNLYTSYGRRPGRHQIKDDSLFEQPEGEVSIIKPPVSSVVNSSTNEGTYDFDVNYTPNQTIPPRDFDNYEEDESLTARGSINDFESQRPNTPIEVREIDFSYSFPSLDDDRFGKFNLVSADEFFRTTNDNTPKTSAACLEKFLHDANGTDIQLKEESIRNDTSVQPYLGGAGTFLKDYNTNDIYFKLVNILIDSPLHKFINENQVGAIELKIDPTKVNEFLVAKRSGNPIASTYVHGIKMSDIYGREIEGELLDQMSDSFYALDPIFYSLRSKKPIEEKAELVRIIKNSSNLDIGETMETEKPQEISMPNTEPLSILQDNFDEKKQSNIIEETQESLETQHGEDVQGEEEIKTQRLAKKHPSTYVEMLDRHENAMDYIKERKTLMRPVSPK